MSEQWHIIKIINMCADTQLPKLFLKQVYLIYHDLLKVTKFLKPSLLSTWKPEARF